MRKIFTLILLTIIKDIHKLFSRKDNKAVWQKFSVENNGKFVSGQYDNLDSVEISYLNYKIIFDRYIYYQVVGAQSYDTEFTRVRLEFITLNDLRFRLTRQGFSDSFGKLFGFQDIQVGDKSFDNKFMIKGNDEYKIQTIFSNQTLQELILTQEDIQLQILDKEGIFDEPIQEGNAMLYYISKSLIKEKEQLNLLLKLYRTLIDQLTKTSSIKPKKDNTSQS